MAKSDKEKELLKQVSDLQVSNANLKKSKNQMGKDIERLTENEVKAKKVQENLVERTNQLTEAGKTIEQQGKQLRGLKIQNQDLLTADGKNSEQGDKIKSQEQEIEKLTSENENLVKKVSKTTGEFPVFSDPSKDVGRATLISTIHIDKNKRMVVYKSSMPNGIVLLYQVQMEGSDCVGVQCSYIK